MLAFPAPTCVVWEPTRCTQRLVLRGRCCSKAMSANVDVRISSHQSNISADTPSAANCDATANGTIRGPSQHLTSQTYLE
eukprot:6197807-Pleurochrysis_carterae.AAC.2